MGAADPSPPADPPPAPAREAVTGGSAILVAETDPEGAEVFVDGQPVGRTPLLREDLLPGTRDIELRLADHVSETLAGRELEDGVVVNVSHAFARGTGRLTVTATPREAGIEIGGRVLAETTPVTLDDLPAGDVTVRVSAVEHVPAEVAARVPMDSVGRLDVELEPYPTLTLELTPPDAAVNLPGVDAAYVPGMRLPMGEYLVHAARAGYVTEERRVHLAGETVERIELRRPSVAGNVFRDCASCPEMVVVPAGGFMMGSPASEEGRDDDEGPQRRVEIARPFAVGVREVTFDEWEACADDGGCGRRRRDDRGWGRGTRPVINVSWEDAQGHVAWLSRETGEEYRLPSEAEWEYAARAGTETRYSWGDGIGSNRANCRGCRSRWDGEGDGSGGFVPPERLGSPRHARQRVGVDGGLLE